jgi:hypothetical protein
LHGGVFGSPRLIIIVFICNITNLALSAPFQ